jgi:hypothetical protein
LCYKLKYIKKKTFLKIKSKNKKSEKRKQKIPGPSPPLAAPNGGDAPLGFFNLLGSA